jgi:GTPase SAR1 family protein
MGCATSSEGTATNGNTASDAPKGKAKGPPVVLTLIGAGESGKSTLFKQLKILEMKGFTDAEKSAFKGPIRANLRAAMTHLVGAAPPSDLGRQYQERATEWSSQLGSLIAQLWATAEIKDVYVRRAELRLPVSDGLPMLMEGLSRISQDDYVPTDADLLRVRLRSAEFDKAEFIFKKTNFCIWDSGGQMTERTKWEQLLPEATAIIFCAPLSDYDQTMQEDPKTIRMHDSLRLMGEVVSRIPESKSVILMMTKLDVLKEKITRKPLTGAFPEYTGPAGALEPAMEFIKGKFTGFRKKNLYVHQCNLLDTDHVRTIWEAVRGIFLNNAMAGIGM